MNPLLDNVDMVSMPVTTFSSDRKYHINYICDGYLTFLSENHIVIVDSAFSLILQAYQFDTIAIVPNLICR